MNILITGGTGAFGQAFVKRLLNDSPYNRICVFSRDEAKQAYMRLKFEDDPRLRFFVGDIRDAKRVSRALRGVDVVVHAAALKRIEVGFYDTEEMVKTNILGTMNVIDAAVEQGVQRVVSLSTDKAFQPVSPYGYSKAISEQLIFNANYSNGANGPSFAVTRYGNVSGSTGSVIPIWREILKTSDTVPVTDPRCTRFCMMMDEAVELVLQVIELDEPGPFTPQLPAYELKDLATAMGAKMDIKGLSKYEKMHESMTYGLTSDTARRMTVQELKEMLNHV